MIYSGIQSKVISIIGAFVLTIGASVLLTLNTVQTQKSDVATIDLAVRLRLATVEVWSETQELIMALESESSADALREGLIEKILKVEGQLLALEGGGNVIDSEGKELVLLASTGDVEVQLKSARESWRDFQILINVVTRSGVDVSSDEFFDASMGMAKRYENALTAITKSIPLLKERAENKIVFLEQIITAAFITTLLVALLVWLYARNQIVSPILDCLHSILDLEQGRPSRLNVTRADEIGQLARGLDTFSDNLQGEILKAFESLSKGDFTFEASGVIREPLAKANATLTDIMLKILDLGHQLDFQSKNVFESSDTLAQGASEQASTLEELSASQQDLARQTLQNAENATEANESAANARKAAEEGSVQMQKMVLSIGEITKASKNISRIVEVINDIAFQTNLLALNASVEAARAGKYGKGFAVVASEVRDLAARTSEASREIATLVERTVSINREGEEIARQSAEALTVNVDEVTRGSDLMAEITTASNEQAKGIEYVNGAISQIEQVTNANACTAEETSAMAKQLSVEAYRLRQMLSRFNLKKKT